MKRFLLLILLLGCKEATPPGTKTDLQPVEVALNGPEVAAALAQKIIIVDGHVDVPYRQRDAKDPIDFSVRTKDGDFDYPRAMAGGLNAPFMSIYVPSKFQKEGGAKKVADELIDMVEGFVTKWPDKFVIARSPEDVRAAFVAKKIALPLGIENGAAIEDDVENVKHFYDRGVRYITLTHAKDNLLCDSSYDQSRTNKGLSELGKKVVKRMNEVGIMVDVSHLSDDSIRQVLEISKAPVIASHSSARHFTPGFERNISDALIRDVAAKGGVVMVNFGSAFLTSEASAHSGKRWGLIGKFMEDNKLERSDPKVEAFADEHKQKNPMPYAKLSNVLDHIDHVAEIAGVDHVGFGSDFDGVGDSLPEGIKDVSMYPNLILGLLERGYSAQDIEKIASGNVFRVWDAVAKVATAP